MSEEKRFPVDPGEIVVDYRRASNKAKQIDVLANLNACQPRDIAELLQERGEELPKIWLAKLEKPRRGSPEDLANRGKRADMNLAANYGDLPLPPSSPTGKGLTVGKLLELLRGLPEETPVLLEGETAVGGVSFTRDYDATEGTLRDRVLLFY